MVRLGFGVASHSGGNCRGWRLVVLLAIHTPWARGRALAWATDFVTRYDLTLRANDLAYNAITRRITLTDVRLAAKGHDDRPFLIANRIEVKLPWIVFRGRFAIDHLPIENGIVDIYRDANDVVNLPPGSTQPTPETPRRLDIRGLTLQRPRRAVRRRGARLGREGPADRVGAGGLARSAPKARSRCAAARRAPARAHHDDRAVRDGDDVRRLRRVAQGRAPGVVGAERRS